MQQPEVLTNVQDVYQLGGGWRIEEYLETQFAIIQSRHVAERVVEKLGLDRDYKFLGIENIQDAEILEEVLKNADPASVLQGRLSVQGTTQSFLAPNYRGRHRSCAGGPYCKHSGGNLHRAEP